MKETYISIEHDYVINMKLYEPESEINGYIIAVHGFCGDMESSAIKALAKRMERHNYAVISFDFVGHGTSLADEHFSLSACQQDIQDVMKFAAEKYSDNRFVGVFATSFGGYITLLEMDSISDTVKIVLRAPAVNMERSFLTFLPDFDKFKADGKCIMGYERRLTVPYSFYDELRNNSVINRNYDRPMLIIHGSRDEVVDPTDIQMFCHINPKAELKIIEKADHRFKASGELDKIIDISEEYFD